MFSSIRARLWLSYALLIAFALAIVAAILAIFLIRNPYVYRETAIRLRAAESLLSRGGAASPRLGLVTEAFDVRVVLLAPDGTVLKDSSAGAAPLRVSAAERTFPGVSITRDSAGGVWLFSRKRQSDGSWLLVAAPRPRLLPVLDFLRDELWRPLLQAGFAALLVALLLAYFLARWIADPLQGLVNAARSIAPPGLPSSPAAAHSTPAEGRVRTNGKAVERGPREVRQLTQAFNAMLIRVQASQRSQREFVANVSHELKTPLTSIQGFSQAILDGTAESPEARRQAVEVIRDEAARMHRMANGLLDLARLDAGTADLSMDTVDLRPLLASVETKFGPLAASAGVGLRFRMEPDIPPVKGDADRLAQVFMNIIDNAIKHTPEGGAVNLFAAFESGEIRVGVVDTGPGIAAEHLPRVFERFYRADSARGGGKEHGAGLGLAIAREITEAHGGRITLRSALGHGAEFVVHLPPAGRN